MAYTTIDDPTLYFSTTLWSGNGTDDRDIVVDGTGMQPDWVWIKERSSTGFHFTFDSIRGATKNLHTNSTQAESTQANALQTFNSNGFQIGNDSDINNSGDTYVSWNWLAGGTASSNTDGSITSTVSANTTAGFSVVTWTGNGSNGATIGHSLNSVPKMMIFKIRSTADDWTVYHTTLGAGKKLNLNDTGAESTVPEIFNNTEPTSSLITFGTHSRTNTNGANYVGYIFAEKKGFSRFGSYQGNGSSDGSYIHLGFKPSFVMLKSTGTNHWVIYDNKRNSFNLVNNKLNANEIDADNIGSANALDFLSLGFKCRATNSASNGSGQEYIYMAFAESPFVTSTGIPTTAR